jgi:hypothetical protein
MKSIDVRTLWTLEVIGGVVPFQWPGAWKGPGALNLLQRLQCHDILVPRDTELGLICRSGRTKGLCQFVREREYDF